MVCASVMLTLPRSRWVAGALLVCALVWFVGLEYRGLFMPDEGRYADIARAMLDTGDWVTPRLNGIKYFEKPPLQYWATAVAFKLFGENEYAARLYIGLAGLATILITAFAASRIYGVEHAVATALVLVSSPYVMALGGIVTLDMGLAVW